MSLLTREQVVEAFHDLFCCAVDSRLDELGRRRPREWEDFRASVPRQDERAALEVMWRLLGRAEQAWGYDVGLVFFHAGIPEEDYSTALYYLMTGCQGHGISLEDRFPGALDRAGAILNRGTGRPFDGRPFNDEMCAFCELACAAYPTQGWMRRTRRFEGL